jgi:hypothetical protein
VTPRRATTLAYFVDFPDPDGATVRSPEIAETSGSTAGAARAGVPGSRDPDVVFAKLYRQSLEWAFLDE